MFSEFCSISALSCSFEFLWWWVGGGVPSDYFVSTQLQLWLFCCWGCGCCWAVKIFGRDLAAMTQATFIDIWESKGKVDETFLAGKLRKTGGFEVNWEWELDAKRRTLQWIVFCENILNIFCNICRLMIRAK